MKKFYFYPKDENAFKDQAVRNFVRTLIFDEQTNAIHSSYTRKVSKKWEQTVKNNIESDQRIKDLQNENYQIYSWVVKTKSDFSLPFFGEK